MAKYVTTVRGSLSQFCAYLKNEILNGSMSASLEEEEQTSLNGVQCCIQVYERYSYMGGNRVSLSLTMLAYDGTIRLTAITAGGSQAMFFKINTFGEEAFLEKLTEAVEKFRA